MAAFTKLSQSPAFSFFPLVYAHVFKMTWTIIFYYKLRSQNLRFLLTRAQLIGGDSHTAGAARAAP